MQLDRTRIAIRERNLLGILDLALRVIASYPLQWLCCLGVVAVPMAVVNAWLVGWMPGTGEEPAAVSRYLWNMFVLTFLEAPAGTALVTVFFGQAMFLDQPRAKELWSVMRRYGWNLAWCQLLVRGVFFAWFVLWLVPRHSDFSAWESWLGFLVLCIALVRAVRPFVNEIVLLERNPLRSRKDYEMTIRRRIGSLHNPSAGDLFARWLGVSVACVVLWTSLFGSVWYLFTQVFLNVDSTAWVLHVGIPCSLWLVAGYIAVVRFLCYLDLRIRREGWEVELIVRSAALSWQEGAGA